MSINTDETTWQTFKRLWQFIRLYKSGLVVAVIALVINAISDTYMISLLKPLLDEGFGNAESDFLRTLPLIIFAMMFVRGISGFVSTYCLSWGIRQCGYASPPYGIQSLYAYACVLLR